MKKVYLVVLAVVLCFTLLACEDILIDPAERDNLETSGTKINSLTMNGSTSHTMRVGGLDVKDWVNVDPRSFNDGDVVFISTNPDVATVVAGTKTVGALWFEITAVAGGETIVYAQSKDGSVKSEEIAITVSSEDWIESLVFNKGGEQTVSSNTYTDWVVVNPAVYNADKIKFISSDETVATVEKDTTAVVGQWFKVTRINAGTVTITAEAENGVISDELILIFE